MEEISRDIQGKINIVTEANMNKVISNDGTPIVFDITGGGGPTW